MQVRVLHVLQRLEAGGTQAFLMNLYRNMDRDKVQFDFLVEYSERCFYDEKIEKMGGHVLYSTVREDFNLLRFKKRLEDVLSTYPYRIIHVHNSNVGWFVLPLAKKHGVTVRIAHSHSNGCVFDMKYIPKMILRKLYPVYATDLFACSTEAGRYCFGNKPFTVIKNAIDAEKFRADFAVRMGIRKELGLSDSFVIGNVGRFKPEKNHSFLIQTFDEIRKIRPDAKLLLVGSGPLEQEIHKRIHDLGLTDRTILL